jgi:hypothetical protein
MKKYEEFMEEASYNVRVYIWRYKPNPLLFIQNALYRAGDAIGKKVKIDTRIFLCYPKGKFNGANMEWGRPMPWKLVKHCFEKEHKP